MTVRLFLGVCLGGAAGSGARYLVSIWALRALGPGFPYGTLIVNLVGSFLIAVVMQVGLTTELLPPGLRVVLASGVLGGFTTYSSFNHETLQCLQEGRVGLAAANVGLTLLSCLLAGALGIATARLITGR